MIRLFAILLCLASTATAEIRIDPARSSVRDGWWSLRIELGLSEVTPYRIFTLDDPRRLVMDFDGVVWDGVDAPALLEEGRATGVRFGPLRDGWSRIVIDLAEPLEVVEAGMVAMPDGANVAVLLESTSAEAFAANAGAPLDEPEPVAAPLRQEEGRFVVVIDPGHGGIDPGADRHGVREADLMLELGHEVAAALADQDGIEVVMTRDGDVFVPLDARISIARSTHVDLLISLHADALEQDEAQGASVYTLSTGGGDRASRRMVERHERGDLLSGVDLSEQGDRVATVLLDLARQETGPAGQRFADSLVQQMQERGVRLNARPRREGQLAVLAAADFPSVLIEAGFLSNARDRARLADTAARAPLVAAIARAVKSYAAQ